MGKIDDYIKEKGLKPSDCDYHTNRNIRGKKGTGKIRVLAHEGKAMVQYTCPECQHEAYAEQEWKRPFSIKCEKCKATLKVPKMKEQAKREAKADAKAAKS